MHGAHTMREASEPYRFTFCFGNDSKFQPNKYLPDYIILGLLDFGWRSLERIVLMMLLTRRYNFFLRAGARVLCFRNRWHRQHVGLGSFVWSNGCFRRWDHVENKERYPLLDIDKAIRTKRTRVCKKLNANRWKVVLNTAIVLIVSSHLANYSQ